MAADGANLDGSRVLVTGASRGYGAAVARALAARGARLLAVLAGDDPGPRVQAAEWGLS
jgi:NAD(P)-dependent dehydrogenase (short-subunit alcohol dehydrogenase family)